MTKRAIIVMGLMVGLLASVGVLPAKEAGESGSSSGSLELRAAAAFNQEDYAKALPLLIRLADQHRDNPAKLGPIQEKIRVCQRSLKANPTREMQAELNERPLETNTLKRTRHARPADGQAIELKIKELGNFEYDGDRGGNIPEDVQKLDGATIRTRGYMIPIDQADNITEFALVPSLFACCFGQPPAVHHTFMVHTPTGKALGYFAEEIVVEGRLQVKEVKDEDLIVSVFRIDCTSVKPAAK